RSFAEPPSRGAPTAREAHEPTPRSCAATHVGQVHWRRRSCTGHDRAPAPARRTRALPALPGVPDAGPDRTAAGRDPRRERETTPIFPCPSTRYDRRAIGTAIAYSGARRPLRAPAPVRLDRAAACGLRIAVSAPRA